MKQTQDQ